MDGETPKELDRLVDRDYRWWELYCGGLTQMEIARREGVTQPTVSRALERVRASIPEVDRQEEVQRSLAMLQRLRAGALDIYEMAPAPVFVGKDGDPAVDPETGRFVRDHAGRLRALETAVKVEQRIGQILGYDAAQKLDMHVEAGERMAAERLAEDAARRVAGDPAEAED